MNERELWTSARMTRRALVLRGGAGLAYALLAGRLPLPPPAVAQSGSNEPLAAFMELSAVLTGHSDLNGILGQEAFTALAQHEPTFGDNMRELLTFFRAGGVDATGLQSRLAAERPELARIPRQVVRAWYLGVVGDVDEEPAGEEELNPETAAQGTANARVVAWEQAMMFVPVADRLPVPSYCGGQAGFWSEPPA